MTTTLIASLISAFPVSFVTARIQPDRRLCVDLLRFSGADAPHVVERATLRLPSKRIENTNPTTAPRTPRYYGPRVLGIALSSSHEYVAVLVLTPEAGENRGAPVGTIAVFSYPSFEAKKVASATLRLFPWQTPRFLATYLKLFSKGQNEEAFRLFKQDWLSDRRGPSVESLVHRTMSEAAALKRRVSQAGLETLFLDFSIDSEDIAVSSDLQTLAVFTDRAGVRTNVPDLLHHHVLGSAWGWKPRELPTKHEGSRFIQLWRDMVIVGTSKSAYEPDEEPYAEAFFLSGKLAFTLEAGALLRIQSHHGAWEYGGG